jgi:hypothetical protein
MIPRQSILVIYALAFAATVVGGAEGGDGDEGHCALDDVERECDQAEKGNLVERVDDDEASAISLLPLEDEWIDRDKLVFIESSGKSIWHF